MRLRVASLRRVVKGDLAMQFVPQQLTSYSGLELLRRYAQRLGLAGRLRAALAGLSSDYGNARLGLMLLALLFVGGRRLEHLQHVAQDPLVTRFCGLARLPTSRTVANWLKQFTHDTLAPHPTRPATRRTTCASSAARHSSSASARPAAITPARPASAPWPPC